MAASLPPPSTLAISPLRNPAEKKTEIENALKNAGAHFVDWVHALDGDILFACDGKIYRHAGTPAAMTPDIFRNAKPLIDLSSMRFELIRAPRSAVRW